MSGEHLFVRPKHFAVRGGDNGGEIDLPYNLAYEVLKRICRFLCLVPFVSKVGKVAYCRLKKCKNEYENQSNGYDRDLCQRRRNKRNDQKNKSRARAHQRQVKRADIVAFV